ncbi:MAG: penicillin-insensitive murein endopeptidase [Bradymonadaceae bacterium]
MTRWMRAGSSMVGTFVMATMMMASPAMAETSSSEDMLYYTVTPDDTLGSIALKFKVGLAELQGWNDLESIDIEPQTTLVVRSTQKVEKPSEPLPVVHIVRRGDTFEGIAKKYRVSVAQVQRWNRRLNPRTLQIGAQVRLYIPGRDGKSTSWGAANGGRLYNGVAMQDSPGLKVRNVARAYGTERTVHLLQAAGADVRARWPDAPELLVGSLSVRSGGRLRPHRSHQSGRDADLAYYHRGNIELNEFRNMSVETFDAVKNWHVFKTLIDTNEVQFIFVDYRLQEVLYEYALSIGYTEAELEPLLQYPHGQGTSQGVIRHARGHLNHWHIRFVCGPEDKQCR